MNIYMDEMPKDCYECPCYYGEWYECRVVGKELDRYYMENDRPEWCPIVLVKHGHWIKIGNQDSIRNMKCSICGEEVFGDVDTEKYCFNCGALMDEVTE